MSWWLNLSEEEKEKHLIKMATCQCCNKVSDNPFSMQRMYGIADTKMSRACPECAEGYFESVKTKYFVEKYKGNSIYEYAGKYFPYWDAHYCYDTIESCRNRIDMRTVAVMDMNTFHTMNKISQ